MLKSARTFFSLVCLLFILCAGKATAAQLPKTAETLWYDVEIFHMWKTAEASLEWNPTDEPDVYSARIRVRPVGTLRHFIPYKECEFTSQLRFMPTQRRLRTEIFEKHLVSNRDYIGRYRFDFQRGTVVGQGFINGKALKAEEFPLPSDGTYYDDFLSFVYNLRMGAFGTLMPGTELRLKTIPTQSENKFTLEVIDPDQHPGISGTAGGKRLVSLHLNRKFLGFHIDRFYIWFSEDDRPLQGLAKDVVGWGDIMGLVRKEGVSRL